MTKDRTDAQVEAAVELPTRLVLSLLTAAVRIAARIEMPLGRLTDLLRTAYFLEYRRRHPRDLATVARKLGVSIRTAGTLNRTLRDAFYAPETEVEPIRQVTAALIGAPADVAELVVRTGLDEAEVQRTLTALQELRWVEVHGGVVRLSGAFRSFVTTDLERRIDGLNHQLGVVANSVWYRFTRADGPTAGARSWTFAARDDEVAAAMERAFAGLRDEALRLEASALAHEDPTPSHRYGITVALAPLEEER